MPVVRLASTDPYHNLALEEWWFDRADEFGPTLILWRNSPCVVIGRHQSPWLECDLRRMHADAVPLVRRTSGGGAVYHDRGNTNFSFIAPAAVYDQERHFRVVIDALASLGIAAWKSDRNDLRVGERKFSGNAFRHRQGRSMHHGTLLVDSDLERLTAYLTPSAALIETKATASVRSAVVNLAGIYPGLTHALLWDALGRAFAAEYGDAAAGLGPASDSEAPTGPGLAAASIAARAAELADWDWLYGHTPAFVRRLTLPEALGAGELAIAVRRGLIEAVEGAGPGVRDTLVGMRYDRRAIREAAPHGEDGELVLFVAEEID